MRVRHVLRVYDGEYLFFDFVGGGASAASAFVRALLPYPKFRQVLRGNSLGPPLELNVEEAS